MVFLLVLRALRGEISLGNKVFFDHEGHEEHEGLLRHWLAQPYRVCGKIRLFDWIPRSSRGMTELYPPHSGEACAGPKSGMRGSPGQVYPAPDAGPGNDERGQGIKMFLPEMSTDYTVKFFSRNLVMTPFRDDFREAYVISGF